MKKTIVFLSIISACGVASTTYAANDVIFTGAISSTTCDLEPVIDGGGSASMINLGTASPSGATGEDIVIAPVLLFELKPKGIEGACEEVLTGKTATISWASDTFNGEGLGNATGSAKGSSVILQTSLDGVTAPNVAIKAGALSHNYTGEVISKYGAKFSAQLKGGPTSGNFESRAVYTVFYD